MRSYKVSVETLAPAEISAEIDPEMDTPAAEDANLQKGPYIAETYPVTIEQSYVVVEI